MGQIEAKPSILTCQIIAGALMMGVLMFAGVTLTMQAEPPPQDAPGEVVDAEGLPPMFLIAAGMTAFILVVRIVVLKVLDNQCSEKLSNPQTEELTPEELLGLYQSRVLISLAMFEGPAFLCLVMFIVEGRWESFGLAMMLLVFMAVNFPTETKFREWIRKHSGQSAYAGDESR